MATRAAERAARNRVGKFVTNRVRTAVLMLVTFDAKLKWRLGQITGVGAAVRIVTFRASVFRVRIVADRFNSVRRIVAFHAQILLTGKQ